MDLDGWRNIVVRVNEGTETKKYDADGNLITDDNQTNSDTSTDTTNEETSTDTAEENVTTVEEPINAPELLTPENYLAVKEILIDRLDI